jgi:hypothetical protein
MVTLALWVATAGNTGGVFVMYAADARQSQSGHGSALVPPHMMPFMSVIAVALVVLVGLVVALVRRMPAARTVWRSGLLLGAAAAAVAGAAAPVDLTWHATFGADSTQWSPPHLLSVLGAMALTVAALAVTGRAGGAGRIALGAGLISTTQVLLIEYDTDVPQLTETLYLPLLVLTGLGCAWLVRHTVGHRFAVSWTVAVFLLFRVAVFAALVAFGFSGPDLPVALVGLVVVDLAPSRVRWPLAGLAVTAAQVVASGTGISSVAVKPTLVSATALALVLVTVLAGLVWKQAVLPACLLVGVLAGPATLGVPEARAHAPGSGPQVGTADIAVTGDGMGTLEVTVTPLHGVSKADLHGARLVARRAGITVTGDVLHATRATVAGSITVPERGLWFVYVNLDRGERHLAAWRAVEYDITGTTAERRSVYLASGPDTRSAMEYVVSVLLYGVGAVLVVWMLLVVHVRHGQVVVHPKSRPEHDFHR